MDQSNLDQKYKEEQLCFTRHSILPNMTNNVFSMNTCLTFAFSLANETRIKEGSQKAAWVLIVKLLRPEHHLGYLIWNDDDDGDDGDDDDRDEDDDDDDA